MSEWLSLCNQKTTNKKRSRYLGNFWRENVASTGPGNRTIKMGSNCIAVSGYACAPVEHTRYGGWRQTPGIVPHKSRHTPIGWEHKGPHSLTASSPGGPYTFNGASNSPSIRAERELVWLRRPIHWSSFRLQCKPWYTPTFKTLASWKVLLVEPSRSPQFSTTNPTVLFNGHL